MPRTGYKELPTAVIEEQKEALETSGIAAEISKYFENLGMTGEHQAWVTSWDDCEPPHETVYWACIGLGDDKNVNLEAIALSEEQIRIAHRLADGR